MGKYDDALFILTKEDAQYFVRDIVGRELSSEELRYVKKGLEYGLHDWSEVMSIAVKKAVETVKNY